MEYLHAPPASSTVDPSQKENTPPLESSSHVYLPPERARTEPLVKKTKSSVWFKRADEMANLDRSASRHINDITNDLTRGAPTDGTPETHRAKSVDQQEVARRRNQYYDEVFAVRENYNTPRHRVNQDAVVVVHVKTNVTIPDHFQAISELSCHLSTTFQRPESSIMIIIGHGVCLMFGGSYEPAYHLTVTALPHLIGPVSNLRNTILIQNAIRDALDIPESRGVVKFETIAEDNLGTNGATLKDEITQLEKKTPSSNSGDGIIRNFSRSMSRRIKPASSLRTNSTAPPVPTAPSSSTGVQDVTRSEDTETPGLVSHSLDLGRTGVSPVVELDEREPKPDAEQETVQKAKSEAGTQNNTEQREGEKEEEDQKLSKNRVLRKCKSIRKIFLR